jgi:hypothetical protein
MRKPQSLTSSHTSNTAGLYAKKIRFQSLFAKYPNDRQQFVGSWSNEFGFHAIYGF